MAKTFLITYDLRKPGQDYSALYDAIKKLGDWQHPLESTWIVKVEDREDINTPNTADHIFSKLRTCIDKTDYIFVINITECNDRQGWLQKSFWEWLKKQ